MDRSRHPWVLADWTERAPDSEAANPQARQCPGGLCSGEENTALPSPAIP